MVDARRYIVGSGTGPIRIPDALLSEMAETAGIERTVEPYRAATLCALLIRVLERYPAWRRAFEGAPRFAPKMDALKRASAKLADLEKIMADWEDGGRDPTRAPTGFDDSLLDLVTRRMQLAPRTKKGVEPLGAVVYNGERRSELDLNVLAAGYETALRLAPRLLPAFLAELRAAMDALHSEMPTEHRAGGKGALVARDWALHLLADVFSTVHNVGESKLRDDARLNFVIAGSRLIEPPNGREEDTVTGALNRDLCTGNGIHHRRAGSVPEPLERINWDAALTAMEVRSPAAIAVLEPLRQRLGEAGPLILA